MSDEEQQIITINVRGAITKIVGNQYGVMHDQLGLARVIDVNTGETMYMERVRDSVRDNPDITIKNYVDHHKARREAQASEG